MSDPSLDIDFHWLVSLSFLCWETEGLAQECLVLSWIVLLSTITVLTFYFQTEVSKEHVITHMVLDIKEHIIIGQKTLSTSYCKNLKVKYMYYSLVWNKKQDKLNSLYKPVYSQPKTMIHLLSSENGLNLTKKLH